MAFKYGESGINRVETIYSAAVGIGGESIAYGVVSKQDGQATTITNRTGEQIVIGDDSLDALIMALQEVQKAIQTGLLKKQFN